MIVLNLKLGTSGNMFCPCLLFWPQPSCLDWSRRMRDCLSCPPRVRWRRNCCASMRFRGGSVSTSFTADNRDGELELNIDWNPASFFQKYLWHSKLNIDLIIIFMEKLPVILWKFAMLDCRMARSCRGDLMWFVTRTTVYRRDYVRLCYVSCASNVCLICCGSFNIYWYRRCNSLALRSSSSSSYLGLSSKHQGRFHNWFLPP